MLKYLSRLHVLLQLTTLAGNNTCRQQPLQATAFLPSGILQMAHACIVGRVDVQWVAHAVRCTGVISVCASMQAIEEKTAAGDTASVQQEVDGIVQQLRLHVCHLSLQHILLLPFALTWSWILACLAWYIRTVTTIDSCLCTHYHAPAVHSSGTFGWHS